MNRSAEITIVMATYNGAEFICEQLESLANQTFEKWQLLVTDDGSTDDTLEIIRSFSSDHLDHKVCVIEGPKRGVSHNFLNALSHPMCKHTKVAFCDQDDVWLAHKLENSASALAKVDGDIPQGYASTAQMVDDTLSMLSATPAPNLPVDFGNLLVENCVTGNTVVLNERAVEVIKNAGVPDRVPFHDWWALLITTACGGTITVGHEPTVLYRQHRGNVVGAATGSSRLNRNARALGGSYQENLKLNCDALGAVISKLTPESQIKLRALAEAQSHRFSISALIKLAKLGIRRQSALASLAMYLTLLLKPVGSKNSL